MILGKVTSRETLFVLPGFSIARVARASGARIRSRLTDSSKRGADRVPRLRTVTRRWTFAPTAGTADRVTAPTARSARRGLAAALAGRSASRPQAIQSGPAGERGTAGLLRDVGR